VVLLRRTNLLLYSPSTMPHEDQASEDMIL